MQAACGLVGWVMQPPVTPLLSIVVSWKRQVLNQGRKEGGVWRGPGRRLQARWAQGREATGDAATPWPEAAALRPKRFARLQRFPSQPAWRPRAPFPPQGAPTAPSPHGFVQMPDFPQAGQINARVETSFGRGVPVKANGRWSLPLTHTCVRGSRWARDVVKGKVSPRGLRRQWEQETCRRAFLGRCDRAAPGHEVHLTAAKGVLGRPLAKRQPARRGSRGRGRFLGRRPPSSQESLCTAQEAPRPPGRV